MARKKMADKRLQRLIYLSDIETKNFLDAILNDISRDNGTSTSFAIETILKNALLPKNNHARRIIRDCLYNTDNGDNGVGTTLEALFSSDTVSSAPSTKEFVEFARLTVMDFKPIDEWKEDSSRLLNSFNAVIGKIEKDIDKMEDEVSAKNQLNWLKELREKLKNEPELSDSKMAKEFVQSVFDFWEILNGWSFTYVFLRNLTKSCDFNETTRFELYNLIREFSEEWD